MQGVASGEPESAVAMQMARAYSDTEPALVAHVRNLRAVTLMGKPDIAERLELLDACVAVAPEVWERDRRTRRGSQTVHALRGLARMAAGDRDGFEADHAESELVVERTGSRLGLGYVMQSRVMIAFLEGDFDAVPALAGAVVNAVPDQPNFQLGMQAHLMWLCFETGRYAEILPLLEPMAAANPRLVALRACLATTQAAVGDADAATSVLASLVEEFEALPRTWLWTPVPFLMAEAAARIGDQVTAAVVLGELDLFAGQVCVFQVATALGAFDRARGMAMLTLGRAEDAVAALEAAVRLEAGLRSEPLVARSRYWLARALASGPQRDLTRAATEASLSLEVAQRLGMSELAAVAGALASNGTS